MKQRDETEVDRYYRRQDPTTYRLLKMAWPDGREETEQPPPWFTAQLAKGANGTKPEPESFLDSLTDEQRERMAQAAPPREDESGRRMVLIPVSTIEPEAVEWAWRGRLPLRAVSLLVGQPGLGKSTLQALLAAELSRGEADGDLHGEPTTVLMASAEDSLTTTIRPRLEAAGADLAHVVMIAMTVDGVAGSMTLPDDVEQLRAAVLRTGARVLMVDPIMAYISGAADSHKDQHVRRVLAPLTALADQLNIAVVGVMHLNKRESAEMLTRVSGSTGFTAAARSVLALGRDPHDEDSEGGSQRIIAHAKCNVGPTMPSLACHIEADSVGSEGRDLPTSRLVIDGESHVSANDLLAVPASREERSEVDDAKNFLLGELASGEKPAADLLKAGAKEGHKRRTLYRARDALNLESIKIGDEFGAAKRKAWRLPEAEG